MKKIKKIIVCIIASAVTAITALPISANCAERETKLIALTFDDGPNTTTTNEVLDVLETYNAKASFFLIGDNISPESADAVKRAYDMGMEIDNHSKTHSNMPDMTREEIQAEISYVDEKVMEITGEPTKFFRPPYIDTSSLMYDAIDLPFICGIDCQDYMPDVNAEERAEYILNGAKDGVIVLLHDAQGNTETVKALEIALPELKQQGYEFVTLTELFERQGEVPGSNMLYSRVAKYPCADYDIYQELSSDSTDKIRLDKNLFEKIQDNYAIEVNYQSEAYPPVIALQKWSATPPVWKAVQPAYANGKTAVFLTSDIASALQETGLQYAELDGISVSAYSGDIILHSAKLLVKPESPAVLTGDADNDGAFTVADIIMLQKWLLCRGSLTNWKAVDMNHDEMITIYDLLLAKQELLY